MNLHTKDLTIIFTLIILGFVLMLCFPRKTKTAINQFESEYIVCAANWYKTKIERMFAHKPINIVTGFVICGHRHHNCYASLYNIKQTLSIECGGEIESIINKNETIEGFLTNKNRFIDRYEAMKLAKTNGQYRNSNSASVRNDHTQKTDMLYSEDIY